MWSMILTRSLSNEEDSPNDTDAQREIFKLKKVTFNGHQSLITTKAEHQHKTHVSHVQDIKKAYGLFILPSVQKILLVITNTEGRRTFDNSWAEIDKTHLDAFKVLLLLAGVNRSCNEATASLCDSESGRSIFQANMSLVLSTVICFENRETRAAHCVNDKLAPIREVWTNGWRTCHICMWKSF